MEILDDAERSQLPRMLDAARRREVDAVMAESLFRFALSTADLLANLRELEAVGARFVAVKGLEVMPDDQDSHQRMATVAAIAEFEHELASKRVVAAIATRKEAGAHVGRQWVQRPNAKRVRALRRRGRTWKEISDELGCSVWAARTVLNPDLVRSGGAPPRQRQKG
jgi:DNA invertase Pin-like site-specific DNA recombinase